MMHDNVSQWTNDDRNTAIDIIAKMQKGVNLQGYDNNYINEQLQIICEGKDAFIISRSNTNHCVSIDSNNVLIDMKECTNDTYQNWKYNVNKQLVNTKNDECMYVGNLNTLGTRGLGHTKCSFDLNQRWNFENNSLKSIIDPNMCLDYTNDGSSIVMKNCSANSSSQMFDLKSA